MASPQHLRREIQESDPAKAERILGEELHSLGWSAGQLEARRKGGPLKVKAALRLRRETTMTLAWIAERLHMGAPTHVACLLYREKKNASNRRNSENTLF